MNRIAGLATLQRAKVALLLGPCILLSTEAVAQDIVLLCQGYGLMGVYDERGRPTTQEAFPKRWVVVESKKGTVTLDGALTDRREPFRYR